MNEKKLNSDCFIRQPPLTESNVRELTTITSMVLHGFPAIAIIYSGVLGFICHHLLLTQAQLVGGFTLSGLLDMAWSPASSRLSPPAVLAAVFYRTEGLALSLLVDLHRIFTNSRSSHVRRLERYT